MTYRIDKDENGEEALIMTAIVRNNTVDLDWVHPGDDVEGFAQRCLVRSRALMGPSHSLPSQNAVFTLRLYRRGDVAVSGMACEDGFREQAIRLATEAAIDLYDEVYPDAALAAEVFIEESIATVRQFAAIHARPHLEAGMGKLLAPDEHSDSGVFAWTSHLPEIDKCLKYRHNRRAAAGFVARTLRSLAKLVESIHPMPNTPVRAVYGKRHVWHEPPVAVQRHDLVWRRPPAVRSLRQQSNWRSSIFQSRSSFHSPYRNVLPWAVQGRPSRLSL